jgi:small subunit ribosomal protein S4
LKGTRCLTEKCAVSRRAYPPGQHGQSRRIKLSDYGLQLREKQKVKRIYGILEKQFRRYFHLASKRVGVTGETLLQLLERRLDNTIFRAGFASNRTQARQLVSHGIVSVDGQRVTIPSFLVSVNSQISLKPSEKLTKLVKENLDSNKERTVPTWLKVDDQNLKADVLRLPQRSDVQFPIQEQLIVELYSK